MNVAKKKKSIELLLVEDNPSDLRLMVEAIRESNFNINLNIVQNGEEAIAYLYKKDKYAQSNFPNLILLDLNLPRKDGREVLAEIKNHTLLRRIPVVVLTTSNSYNDILTAYNLQANCYITKPIDKLKFNEVMNSIGDFWFNIAQLPSMQNNHYYNKKV